MSRSGRIVGELDLLAYADGLLDSDPQRKAEVQSYLRENFAAAARVRAYMDQNAQIRAQFAHVLDEPVPLRLKAAIESRVAATGAWRVVRFGIAASLMLAMVAVGWWLGVTMQRPSGQLQDFLHQAVSTYRLEDESRPPVPALVKASPLGLGAEQISRELQPPDLSEQGYALVGRRLMTRGGRHVVRLSYENVQGQRINLVLGTRWQEDEVPKVRTIEDGQVTVAYWRDGSMIYGLVGQLERYELLALAKAARNSPRLIPDAVPDRASSTFLSGAEARTDLADDSHHGDPMQPRSIGGMQ